MIPDQSASLILRRLPQFLEAHDVPSGKREERDAAKNEEDVQH